MIDTYNNFKIIGYLIDILFLATGNSTFIGRKKDQQIVVNLPDRGATAKPVISSNIVQLDLSFIIGKLELEVDKESEPFFKFAINATSSK